MRKILTPLIIVLVLAGSTYAALVANLFPNTTDFPHIPMSTGSLGDTLSRILGTLDLGGYAGDGTVENSDNLAGAPASDYLKKGTCSTMGEVWLGIDTSGSPICGPSGSLYATIIGTLTGVTGNLTITKYDGSSSAGNNGDTLYFGDIIETAGSSSGTIAFSDASIIRLDELTSVELTTGNNSEGDTIAQVILTDGNLWGRVLTSTGINFEAGGYIAGVRGTSISAEKTSTGFIVAILDSVATDATAAILERRVRIAGYPAPLLISSGTIVSIEGTDATGIYIGKNALLTGNAWRSENTIRDLEYLIQTQDNPRNVVIGTTPTSQEELLIRNKATNELQVSVPAINDTSMCTAVNGEHCTILDMPTDLSCSDPYITPEKKMACIEIQTHDLICDKNYGGAIFWPTMGKCVMKTPDNKRVIWMANYGAAVNDTTTVDQKIIESNVRNLSTYTEEGAPVNGAYPYDHIITNIPPLRGRTIVIDAATEMPWPIVNSTQTIKDNGYFSGVYEPGLGNNKKFKNPLQRKDDTTSSIPNINDFQKLIENNSQTIGNSTSSIFVTKPQLPITSNYNPTGEFWGESTYPGGSIWVRDYITWSSTPSSFSDGIPITAAGQYISYPVSQMGNLAGKTVRIELSNPVGANLSPYWTKAIIADFGTEQWFVVTGTGKCAGLEAGAGQYKTCHKKGTETQEAISSISPQSFNLRMNTNPTQFIIGNIWTPTNSFSHLKGPIGTTIKRITITD